MGLFLGEVLLAWLTLDFCGAFLVWNALAIVKTPAKQLDDTYLERAPVGRSVVYAGIGLVAAVWALASLISG